MIACLPEAVRGVNAPRVIKACEGESVAAKLAPVTKCKRPREGRPQCK